MRQIIFIIILSFTINDIMGGTLGHGIVIANCPDLEVNSDGEATCINIVDGYIKVELIFNDPYATDDIVPHGNPIPVQDTYFGNHKVDFSSINGFTIHGIPLKEVENGGYMINIPASNWTYSTFFFSLWLKDTKGHIVANESYEISVNICSGANSPRLGQENKSIIKPILSEIELIYKSDDNVKIFPNPSPSDVTIEIPILQSGTIVVKLFNEKGKLIYSNSDQVFENTKYLKQINNLHIPKGIYICQITTDYGKKYATKMVKL